MGLLGTFFWAWKPLRQNKHIYIYIYVCKYIYIYMYLKYVCIAIQIIIRHIRLFSPKFPFFYSGR